jgi:hypothetical protein
MPSFVPRQEPIRKKEQLSQKEMELVTAIRKNFTGDKLLKFIDKYRHSQLAMLKAKIHFLREQEFQKKHTSLKIEKLENEIIEWTNKSNDMITNEVKTKFIDTQS